LKGKRKNEEYLSEARSLLIILIACLNIGEERWKMERRLYNKHSSLHPFYTYEMPFPFLFFFVFPIFLAP
jgi:hypothetical protein